MINGVEMVLATFSRYFPFFSRAICIFRFFSVSLSLHSFSLSISIRRYWLPIRQAARLAFLTLREALPEKAFKFYGLCIHDREDKDMMSKDFIHKKKRRKNSKRNERCNLFQHLFSFRYSGWCEKKEVKECGPASAKDL